MASHLSLEAGNQPLVPTAQRYRVGPVCASLWQPLAPPAPSTQLRGSPQQAAAASPAPGAPAPAAREFSARPKAERKRQRPSLSAAAETARSKAHPPVSNPRFHGHFLQCVGVFFPAHVIFEEAKKAEVSNRSTANTRFLRHLTQSLALLPRQNFQTTFLMAQ